MNKHLGTTFVLLAAFLGGCAQHTVKNGPAERVSKDYEAIGNATGIYPFLYGKHTLVEFESAPFGLTVKDVNGDTVGYKKEGRYYSLDRKLDYFTITTGGREVIFSLAPPEEPPLGPLVDPQDVVADESGTPSSTVMLQTFDLQPSHLDEPAFKLMAIQLRHYRQLLAKAESDERVTGAELQALNNKLDGLQKKMDAGVAIIHVYFPQRATTPAADDNALKIALEAAKHADRINIYGRTSSVVAGIHDPDIAINRAVNIKKHLVAHGVSDMRIHVTSLAEGDFIVAPALKQAATYNRRAAIEIIRD